MPSKVKFGMKIITKLLDKLHKDLRVFSEIETEI